MKDNYEIFQELYEETQRYSLEEVIERWSGINVSVPAFCGKVRDIRIVSEYHALSKTLGKEKKYYILAKKFGVSNRKIATVVKEYATDATTPSLFDR